MKLQSVSQLPLLVFCLSLVTTAMADEGGYVPPRFLSGASNSLAAKPLALQQASPLAGGPAAAQGGQFMDVQGNPIILPASYCQSAPAAGGDFGAGCNGDPMAVDFGCYGQDQCGPHYFDVALDSIFLIPLDTFEGVPPLISAGTSFNEAQGNRLDPISGQEEYEAGWRIAARFDLGPLSVIEGTYMGLYDIGFTNRVTSEEALESVGLPPTSGQLFTIFSDYGIPTPIATIDFGDVYTFDYQSDLQSTEISYRRYWVGFNSRVSGTFLLGTRYLRMTEGFSWDIVADDPTSLIPENKVFSNQHFSSENDLIGFQFGGDGWLTLLQGLRIGTEMKAGVYNNRWKLKKQGMFDQIANSPDDFEVESDGNQVAFAAESSVSMVADIMPSWSIRGGYQVFYMSSLASVGGGIDPSSPTTTDMATQSHAIYHGFSGGLEYVW